MSLPQKLAPETSEEESLTNRSVKLKERGNLKHGWLVPYIDHDLNKSLRSSEKVELWLRAHFSHPIGEQSTNYVQENGGLQYGERTQAAESVLTSLAALVISSGIMCTVQDGESSTK